MIPYQVIWEPSAWKMLHVLWRNSSNKQEFASSRKRIEDLMGGDPHGSGTSLSERLFRFMSQPLAVCYSIDTPQRQVIISDVYEIV